MAVVCIQSCFHWFLNVWEQQNIHPCRGDTVYTPEVEMWIMDHPSVLPPVVEVDGA